MTDNSTDNSISGDQGSGSSDGGAAVDSSLSLSELNTFLGKDFKDKDTALKALKDTQAFVGKRKDDIAAEVRAELAQNGNNAQQSPGLESKVQQLENDLFYSKNAEYEPYKDVIAKMGSSPAEVVLLPEFQKVFEQGKVANEVQNSRSVVSSNSRLAQVKTHTESAVAIANARGSSKEDVAEALVGGIKDAFELS